MHYPSAARPLSSSGFGLAADGHGSGIAVGGLVKVAIFGPEGSVSAIPGTEVGAGTGSGIAVGEAALDAELKGRPQKGASV